MPSPHPTLLHDMNDEGIVPDGATLRYLNWKLPVLHRLADDVRQVLFVDFTGSANE